MGFSDRKKRIYQQREEIAQRKLERAKSAVNSILNSDSFINSVLTTPEARMNIDYLMEETVREITNPVTDFLDVLHTKGYRTGQIRKIVFKIYGLYCREIDENGNDLSPEETTYEKQLDFVASYVATHQEVYHTIDELDIIDD